MPNYLIKSLQVQLLSGEVATADGEWIYVGDFDAWTVIVTGITTATIQLWVSNVPSDSSEHSNREIKLGADITADGLREMAIGENYAWLRAKVSAWTSGTIFVDFHGFKE